MGSPLYPLGSVQDAAVQLSLLKDQQVESQKFIANAQLMVYAALLPRVTKSGSHDIQKEIDKLIQNTSLVIEYEDEIIQKMTEERRLREIGMMKAVQNAPSEPFRFRVGVDKEKLRKKEQKLMNDALNDIRGT